MTLVVLLVSSLGAGATRAQDGTIVAWGSHSFGVDTVPPPNSYVAIAAGGKHNLALKHDGRIVAWGRNYDGECDVPVPNDGFVAVAACGYYGPGHSLGLKADGTISAWGSNLYGESNEPEPNGEFVGVAGG